MKGLKGAELADGLVIKEGEYKLVKTRFSAFFATHLDSVLKTAGIKNLVIVGRFGTSDMTYIDMELTILLSP